jgi:hypothetical protein
MTIRDIIAQARADADKREPQTVVVMLQVLDKIEVALAGESQAARDVLAERQRQIKKEGWTPEHDDEHTEEGSTALGDRMTELVAAATCYLTSFPANYSEKGWHHMTRWPWNYDSYKPQCGRRGQLVKAGALILAEIERLDRAEAKAVKP